MDYSNILRPKRLTNMQEMEVYVNGPDGANRLFIHSGMAEVEISRRTAAPALDTGSYLLRHRQDLEFTGRNGNKDQCLGCAGGWPNGWRSEFCRLADIRGGRRNG